MAATPEICRNKCIFKLLFTGLTILAGHGRRCPAKVPVAAGGGSTA